MPSCLVSVAALMTLHGVGCSSERPSRKTEQEKQRGESLRRAAPLKGGTAIKPKQQEQLTWLALGEDQAACSRRIELAL